MRGRGGESEGEAPISRSEEEEGEEEAVKIGEEVRKREIHTRTQDRQTGRQTTVF